MIPIVIQSQLEELTDTKEDIRTNIENRGVSTDNIPFTKFGGRVAMIEGGSPTLGYYVVSEYNPATVEFRISFLLQNTKFGYYALAIGGDVYTKAVPITQPIITANIFSGESEVSVFLYDLRDLLLDDVEVDFSEQSFESLLDNKAFNQDVNKLTPVSAVLDLDVLKEWSGIYYGDLRLREEG